MQVWTESPSAGGPVCHGAALIPATSDGAHMHAVCDRWTQLHALWGRHRELFVQHYASLLEGMYL